MEQRSESIVLGLDLGSNSIGWALVAFEADTPQRIVRTGVRCFEAGVEGDIESGRDESRARKRREARLQRRQIWRRARRTAHVARLLQRAGLLPTGKIDTEEERLEFFTQLDRTISSRILSALPKGANRRRMAHVIPYHLRARALDERLDPHELGRALYHLAHRRGFLSNRRAPVKVDEEPGKVSAEIGELEERMEQAGARTLGEYLAGLDPEQERIRSRWTARRMYEEEFERIWESQSRFHSSLLTDQLKTELHQAIFYQRPLKSQKGLIGECELERGYRRAPKSSVEFQRFRFLQKVNDLEVISKQDGLVRPLEAEERETLISKLEEAEKMKFTEIRKLLGLRGTVFNFEHGGEKKLLGNGTVAAMIDVFGERWHDFSTADKERILEDVCSIQKDEVLKRRGMEVWGLDEDAAEKFSHTSLEEGYCNLSRRALRKILPELEKGRRYSEIVKELYGEPERPVLDWLPAVDKTDLALRNPAVHRALTELRKVVNSIIREHGKPDKIRIELARDLKQPRKERKYRSAQMRKNETARNEAKARILEETGLGQPSRTDILKVQLAEECNWQCPYTGRQINMGQLVGPEPQFDIEHIIPYHRCLDDSFVNKTLCYHEENRDVKKNQTPFEAYAETDRWDDILQRVRAFKGRMQHEKLRRFQLESLEEFEDFSERQLNDTRYVSTLAADYLALLYGGLWDKDRVRRIQASKGGITAQLRNAWGLNRILSDGPGKSRDDHRHHAVDALAIALAGPGTVKSLSEAAARCIEHGQRRWWNHVEPPWEGFLDDVRAAVDQIVVSHRVSRKVNGPLHEETYYGHKEGSEYVHVRKAVASLSKNDVGDIVDDMVRACVSRKLGGGDPKEVFKKSENHPFMIARDGRKIPIHRVRLRKRGSVNTIASGVRRRHVMTGSNHHVEIVEVTDIQGNRKWKGYVVSTYEAMRRLKAREPIVKRQHSGDERFLFSLAINECVRMRDDEGQAELYRTAGVSEYGTGQVVMDLTAVNDARQISKIPRKGRTKTPDTLRKLQCEKVMISPFGEVRWAND